MPTFIYDKDRDCMVDKNTGEPMVKGEWKPATPMTFGDLPGYRSPVTGKWIEGRRARRYDMESNNCVDANDFPSRGGKLKNPRFAKKHGLEHLLEDKQ